MKNKKHMLLTVFMLITVMAAWSQNVSGNLGETLNLSGQVNGLNGNLEVAYLGITGFIVEGQFNFTIGTPGDNNLRDIENAFRSILWQSEGTSFSDASARAVSLYLYIGNGASIVHATPGFRTAVEYFYVDRDVTINRDSAGNVNAYSLELKRGWNAIIREDWITFTLGDREDLLWEISQDM